MNRELLISKLEELKSIIENCRCHHCEGNQLGFNVKVYKLDDGNVFDEFREKYKDDEKILDIIEESETDSENYNTLCSYQESSFNYAKEVFVDECTTYSKGYFDKKWIETEGKTGFIYLKSLEMAKEWDKEQDLQRYAFDKIENVWTAGRMGGYFILDYRFMLNLDEIEDWIYNLKEGYELEDYENECGYTVEDIDYEIQAIKLIRDEVKGLREGFVNGWKDYLKDNLEQEINNLLESRKRREELRLVSSSHLLELKAQYGMKDLDFAKLSESFMVFRQNDGKVEDLLIEKG